VKYNIVYNNDCLDQLKLLPDNSIDSIVTDPPYGISFMGKPWDNDIPDVAVWKECLRVLKPGGHLLSFGGTRTYQDIASSIKAAGFEIRDCIAWLYGQGFPKSHDLGNGWGTQLKPALELICMARKPLEGTLAQNILKYGTGAINIDACRVKAVVGDKPKFPDGEYSTDTTIGAIRPVKRDPDRNPTSRFPPNIIHDGSDEVLEHFPDNAGGGHWAKTKVKGYGKFGGGESTYEGPGARDGKGSAGRFFKVCQPDQVEVITTHSKSKKAARGKGIYGGFASVETHQTEGQKLGRFPANIIHDGSDDIVELFPTEAGAFAPVRKGHSGKSKGIYGDYTSRGDDGATFYGERGSAARFFYCAKASRRERDFGLEGEKKAIKGRDAGQDTRNVPHKTRATPIGNFHPTVKPVELMRYLARLVTPKGGIVLDPFLGSGTTAIAASLEGFKYIGIERDKEYTAVARKRIKAWERGTPSSRRP
jgi:DNA modification methylase